MKPKDLEIATRAIGSMTRRSILFVLVRSKLESMGYRLVKPRGEGDVRRFKAKTPSRPTEADIVDSWD